MATPMMYARGVYKVNAPYAVEDGLSYTCIGIRSFQDIRNGGENVYDLYYKPKGVSQAQYDQDDLGAVSIITLYCEDRSVLHIPDSYITEVPTGTSTGYSRVVVGAEIGIVPNALSLTYLKTELAQRLSQITGLEVVVQLYTAPYTGTITPQQQASFDRVRAAQVGSLQTVYAQLEAANAELAKLRASNAALTKIILDSGIVVPTA